MNRLGAALALSLVLVAGALLPIKAEAATNLPFFNKDFRIVPNAADFPGCTEGAPFGFAAAMQMIQNLMNLAITVGGFIIFLVIVYAGILFMTSAANPEAHSKARTMMGNAIIGFIIMIAAWLVVDFIMKALYNPDSTGWGPWNSLLTGGGDYCITAKGNKGLLSFPLSEQFKNPIVIPINPNQGGTGGTSSSGGGASTSGGGRCAAPSTGACSVTSLQPYFGSAAREASQICNAESRGNIQSVSATDVMRNDPQRRAFSFGLFQINLTYHEVAGLDCPSAFVGKNYTARVKDEALYARCVAAAKTASANIAEAVATHKRTGWREWSTGKLCKLAEAPIITQFAVVWDRLLHLL